MSSDSTLRPGRANSFEILNVICLATGTADGEKLGSFLVLERNYLLNKVKRRCGRTPICFLYTLHNALMSCLNFKKKLWKLSKSKTMISLSTPIPTTLYLRKKLRKVSQRMLLR